VTTNYRIVKKGVFMRDEKEDFLPAGTGTVITWIILSAGLISSIILFIFA
jgi:hypothetical protein